MPLDFRQCSDFLSERHLLAGRVRDVARTLLRLFFLLGGASSSRSHLIIRRSLCMTQKADPETRSDSGQTKNSATATGGSVSNSGNISQTVNVPEPTKTSTIVSIVIPLLAAVISGVGGAYAANRFALMMAPEKTRAESNTLLGLVRETIEISATKQLPPEVIERLKQLEQQAKAVEANVTLLQHPAGVASGQADFWLRKNNGVILGRTTSFGVTGETGAGELYIVVNGSSRGMAAGGRVDFKTDTGKDCFVTYTNRSPDGPLYGFKIACGA